MSARQSDLLINPQTRWVIEDRGITWVTDRFVLLRGDLFARPPKPASAAQMRGLPLTVQVSTIRNLLTEARAAESTPVTRQRLRFVASDGTRSIAAFSRGALIFMNERVASTLYGLDLTPRYIHPGTVAWWGTRRGKRTLCGIQKAVNPYSLEPADLTWEAA